jgi:hypothetical protein
VSERRKRSFITPYVIGASDLAFILLFFFIVVGGGPKKIEKIEMPFKQASMSNEPLRAPFRIEIYDQKQASDSCVMTVICTRAAVPDTLYIAIDKDELSERDGYMYMQERLSSFVQRFDMDQDSIHFDIFSSAYSFYGPVALSVAACNQLNYPCNLVYRTKSG